MSDRNEAGTWAHRDTEFKPSTNGVAQVCQEKLQAAVVIAQIIRCHAILTLQTWQQIQIHVDSSTNVDVYSEVFRVPTHHSSLAVNYSDNDHGTIGCNIHGSSTSLFSSGRNGASNADFHTHHHISQAPPPAHHHHHNGRNDVLRNPEITHPHAIREAHSMKSSTWGPNPVPSQYREEIPLVNERKM